MTPKDGVLRISHLNAKPVRAIDHWLRDSEAYWSQTLREHKNYVEDKPSTASSERHILV